MRIEPILLFKNFNRTIKDDKCNICLDPYKFKERIIETICCKHNFHTECFKTAIKNAQSCPICRKDFNMNLEKIEDYFKDKPGFFQKIKQDCTDVLFPVDNPIESEDEEDEPKNVGDFFRKYPGTEDEHFAAQEQFERINNNNNNNNNTSDNEDEEMEYEYQNTNISSYSLMNYSMNTDNNFPVTQLSNNFDDTGELDRILKLSEETHRMEQIYQKELNDAIKKSMQHRISINNNPNNRYPNNRYPNNNDMEQQDKGLEEILFKIAIEESQFSELNNQWNSNQIYGNYYGDTDDISINVDNEFIDNDYYKEDNISYINSHKLDFRVLESKPFRKQNIKTKEIKNNKTEKSKEITKSNNDNNIKSEIQYLIKKRKSFGKTMPKIERDNSFNNLYKVQIVGY
jgi:hypothetical protein